MTDSIFLDTNLWVYLYSQDPANKTQQIAEIIRSDRPRIQISTQVLGELFHVLVRKKFLSRSQTIPIISRLISDFQVASIDSPKVLKALEIGDRYGYSYWDSLILATAILGGCTILYSEDMHHNQLIDQLIDHQMRIINPFQPESLTN